MVYCCLWLICLCFVRFVGFGFGVCCLLVLWCYSTFLLLVVAGVCAFIWFWICLRNVVF